VDGNNEILPLAWAVVLIEDEDNWKWFLNNLKDCLYEVETISMVIVSDWNKGLHKAVQQELPNAYHSYYYPHLTDNIQAGYWLVFIYFGGQQMPI
jgi:zinc finger SWIM domain-containing protein 3